MLGYLAVKKQFKGPFAAVYLDFDEVINRCCAADKTGFTGGTLIAGTILAEVNALCKKHNIPVYIITNRAANDKNQQHIDALIHQVGGFANDKAVGGFKKTYIHFLGIESRNRQGFSSLIGVHRTKRQEIDAIHQKELSFLEKSAQLVVDDDADNLNPVKKGGYATHLAAGDNDAHMQVVLNFVKARIAAFYDYSVSGASSSSTDTEFSEPSSSSAAEKTYQLSEKYACKDALYLKFPVSDEKPVASVTIATAHTSHKFQLG